MFASLGFFYSVVGYGSLSYTDYICRFSSVQPNSELYVWQRQWNPVMAPALQFPFLLPLTPSFSIHFSFIIAMCISGQAMEAYVVYSNSYCLGDSVYLKTLSRQYAITPGNPDMFWASVLGVLCLSLTCKTVCVCVCVSGSLCLSLSLSHLMSWKSSKNLFQKIMPVKTVESLVAWWIRPFTTCTYVMVHCWPADPEETRNYSGTQNHLRQ